MLAPPPSEDVESSKKGADTFEVYSPWLGLHCAHQNINWDRTVNLTGDHHEVYKATSVVLKVTKQVFNIVDRVIVITTKPCSEKSLSQLRHASCFLVIGCSSLSENFSGCVSLLANTCG
jgi:hypothetical protein